ncbi:TonB-dependent receptor [Aquimarina sp. TRL1]|uniref:TonB-dependent receptor n=1 Tax=Aquimarina sp. (strain TRL1) TaxID=2736252 RepID=UPI00158F0144|nr:TonB-dependent receptor [Aquimarina sp. TRL1]QKX03688.1 TonB-dependent receptor [Aquimarina sp. TRL1]
MLKFVKRNAPSFLFFLVSVAFSQSKITGTVTDENATPIPEATILIKEINGKGTVSNFNGQFSLELPKGSYTLVTSYLGFKSTHTKIVLSEGDQKEITIALKEDINQLKDVHLTAKTGASKVKEQAFEVEAIQIKGLKNISTDINAVLQTVPGVNIRQSGGLGSDFNFSLNGLSGKQVKFFINNIPQENLGSSLTFNNFPATLIERVEVFKGVVPIYLGSDAMGGSINIITNKHKNNFLDVSYDGGSFNTHRATLNTQYYSKTGFKINLSSYYNYSDNDYTIDGILVRDELGNDTGERRNNVRRFHDAYESQMINIQAGIVDKKIADELAVRFIASSNNNEIQHSIDPEQPFGEVFEENNVKQAAIIYRKSKLFKERLKLNLYASIAENRDRTVDTASRRYDWFGNFKVDESNGNVAGEFGRDKTLFEFKDNIYMINFSSNYEVNENSSVSVNYTKNYLRRRGKDPAKLDGIPFETPHILDKNILGLSYDISLLDNMLNTSLFTKGYILQSEGVKNTERHQISLEYFENRYEKLGYGMASSYKVTKNFLLKGSFEKSYRIPEGYEMFGDGLLLESNPFLLPEESYNGNLGFIWDLKWNDIRVNIDSNLFIRDVKNLMVLTSEGIYSRYNNYAETNNIGIESEITTSYNDFFFSVNTTYQNIKDKRIGERVANIPYFFGNLRTGYNFEDLFSDHDNLSLSFDSYYVHEFPFMSFSNGNPSNRRHIPEQLSHNAQLGYSFKKGQYNISVQARNFTDAVVKDNMDIQKPGRAFYVKFRYFISNKNN